MKNILRIISGAIALSVISSFGEKLEFHDIIKCSIDENNHYIYHLPVVYGDASEDIKKEFRRYVPGTTELLTCNVKEGLKVRAKNQLTAEEFFDSIGILLEVGLVPSWDEIGYLSYKKSSNYSSNNCTMVVSTNIQFDSFISSNNISTADFKYITRGHKQLSDKVSLNSYAINYRAPMCMGHSYYSIRLISADNQVLWENTTLGGDLRVAWLDLNQNEKFDLIIHQDNHGEETVFMIRENVPTNGLSLP